MQQALERVLADPQIEVAPIGTPTPSPPSPLAPDVFGDRDRRAGHVARRLRRRADARGIPIVPFMETGATDGLFLRNAGMPVYGVTGIAYDPEDVRAHGKDERILVRSFDEGLEFAYRIARALAGPAQATR